MRKVIMKGKKTSADLSNVRRWMAIAAVPLFALICSFALKSEAYADVMEYTVEISVEGTDTAECMAIASVDQTAQGETVTITATPADRFQRWIVTSENVELASTTTAQTTFTMPNGVVSIRAVFTAAPQQPTSPNPSNDDSSGDPPKNDDPDPNEPMREFLDDVQKQAKDVLKALARGYNFPSDLLHSGVTIDAGTWESFDKATAEELDNLIVRGVPVNIKYVHNKVEKTVTIPANFKFKLKDMCDKNGFVGFEYIYLIVAKPEVAPNTVMGAEAGLEYLKSINAAVNAAYEGRGYGSASEAVQDRENGSNVATSTFTPFAAFGGSSLRAESG